MKQRHSRYRHRSKYTNRRQALKASKQNHVCNRRNNNANGTDLHISKESLKWSRICTAIQLADFLIDKVPRLCKWLIYWFECVSKF